MSPMLLNILIFGVETGLLSYVSSHYLLSNFPTKISIFSNIGDIKANLSRNRTVVIPITSHMNSMNIENTTTFDLRNAGPDLHRYENVAGFNWLMGS
jgi:hypothetical protein